VRIVGSVTLHGEKIAFGAHAVDRFRQRVEPEMGFMEARAKLEELAAGAKIQLDQPRGIRLTTLRDQILNDGWLVFKHKGQLVVLPLVPWPNGHAAPTCLARKEKA
jgi:hypothetical protein